jgi:acyl-CoA synthetase (AMP-forming)/AMP-acid ligase II
MAVQSIRLVQDFLTDQASRRPDKTALICENRRLTYAQVDEMAGRLAHALHDHGVRAGDRVLFYLLNGVELAVGIFAALKANAIFVGVDSNNTYETLRSIASDCAITALITYDHRADAAARLKSEIPSLRLAVLTGGKAGHPPEGLLSFDAVQAGHPPEPPASSRIDKDLAYLIYTSGSTGQSKGVMVTHREALFTIHSGIEYLGLSDADIQASPLQLSFSPGINQIFQIFRTGGTLILERSLAFPAAVLKRMEAEKASGFSGVPTMLTLLMKQDLGRYDLGSLRYVTSVGASLPPPLIEEIRRKLPGSSIYSYYGMAEASYSLGLDPAQVAVRPASVGKPFPGTQAWVVDEQGRRLGPGLTGELILRGSHVRSGYWSHPEATAQRFRPGPVPGEAVCHSGDLFRTDEDGFFYFVGRSDEIIKSGAKKVVPREIETALAALDGVLEAAAVGVPDPILGQAIKAFVVPTAEARATLTAEVALRHCKRLLEDYKVPREVEIRDSLPKTPSGKILKTGLT